MVKEVYAGHSVYSLLSILDCIAVSNPFVSEGLSVLITVVFKMAYNKVLTMGLTQCFLSNCFSSLKLLFCLPVLQKV